ncbi:MAG TPA: ECF-type sigma factor [Bryobacteraceae bacterium]|nr:ECF-type sigma factor [Bryobacteraceae bacterium]
MAAGEQSGEITRLLDSWAQGDATAVDRLAPLVYDQLHQLAESLLRNERADHTLQGTALVNEMFQQFMKLRKVSLRDRSHFYTFSAKLMRRLLVDYARQAKAVKRGVSFKRVPLNAELAWITPQQENHLDLSAALEELYAIDEAKARSIELRYFLGCTVDETASILGVSSSSVERDIRFSLVWLHDRLHPAP